jgi:hypothetical protein
LTPREVAADFDPPIDHVTEDDNRKVSIADGKFGRVLSGEDEETTVDVITDCTIGEEFDESGDCKEPNLGSFGKKAV